VTVWQYLVLAGFGAFHGLNPGMGSLIALAAGLREHSRPALLKTLPLIAAGHALSVFAAALLITLVRSVVTTQLVAIVGGTVLVGVGLWRAFQGRHRHDSAFRPTGGQLITWSFLMSSVHGAGLALLPVLVAMPVDGAALGAHVHGATVHIGVSLWTGLCATTVHTVAMITVAGGLALLAFELMAVAALRADRWLNLDLVWAFALIGSGILTVSLSLIP
jgi:hypothetical protein